MTIPENSQLTTIGFYAFQDCTSLTSITIPASVTSIGEYAFYNCTSLGTITFKGTTPPAEFGADWAPSTDTLAVIVVPAASKSLYETALGETYAAIIAKE